MLFCKMSRHHIDIETTDEFAALMDFFRKPKKSESVDIDISIKIKSEKIESDIERRKNTKQK